MLQERGNQIYECRVQKTPKTAFMQRSVSSFLFAMTRAGML